MEKKQFNFVQLARVVKVFGCWQLWNQDMQKTFQEKLEEALANALLFFRSCLFGSLIDLS